MSAIDCYMLAVQADELAITRLYVLLSRTGGSNRCAVGCELSVHPA